MDESRVEELTLERKQFIISRLVDEGCIFDDIYLEYLLEDCMYQLTIVHKPFVQVLQEEHEVVSMPSSNWQWFKSIFGLNHKRKRYYMNEFITFPDYKFPDKLGEPRVFIQTGKLVL